MGNEMSVEDTKPKEPRWGRMREGLTSEQEKSVKAVQLFEPSVIFNAAQLPPRVTEEREEEKKRIAKGKLYKPSQYFRGLTIKRQGWENNMIVFHGTDPELVAGGEVANAYGIRSVFKCLPMNARKALVAYAWEQMTVARQAEVFVWFNHAQFAKSLDWMALAPSMLDTGITEVSDRHTIAEALREICTPYQRVVEDWGVIKQKVEVRRVTELLLEEPRDGTLIRRVMDAPLNTSCKYCNQFARVNAPAMKLLNDTYPPGSW